MTAPLRASLRRHITHADARGPLHSTARSEVIALESTSSQGDRGVTVPEVSPMDHHTSRRRREHRMALKYVALWIAYGALLSYIFAGST